MPESILLHITLKNQIIKPNAEKKASPDIILSEAPSLVNTLSIGVSLHTSAGT